MPGDDDPGVNAEMVERFGDRISVGVGGFAVRRPRASLEVQQVWCDAAAVAGAVMAFSSVGVVGNSLRVRRCGG